MSYTNIYDNKCTGYHENCDCPDCTYVNQLYAELDWLESFERDNLAEIERIKEICGNDCNDWLRFVAFEGNHEFYKGDEHLDDFAAYLKQEVR